MSQYVVMPQFDYEGACGAIRMKTNTTELIKSGELAEKIISVYDKGLEDGKAQGGSGSYEEGYGVGFSDGHAQGVEEGIVAEQMDFWTKFQENISKNERMYDYAFGGKGWNNDTFKPKYDIKPTRAQYMFSMSGIQGDLVALCEAQDITIDFSDCRLFNNAFANANGITRIGVIDARKQTDNGFMFINMRSLVTFDKYVVSETTPFNYNSFEGVTNLVSLTVEGTIGQNYFNVKYCTKLNKPGLTSIINCLSATTTGLSVTLSLEAVKKAFETSEGANDGNTSEEWLNLIATKPNWTINLA